MHQRKLGSELHVSAIGYGAMVLSPGYYEAVDEDLAQRALDVALDSGITLIDTADAYGEDSHNERLLRRLLHGRRDHVTIATKFGMVRDPQRPGTDYKLGWDVEHRVNAAPDYARECIDGSLRRLGIETVDLWYLHWPEPGRPIEETVGAMAEAVAAGKARHLGLSNVTGDELRRACEVAPIAAVQSEYSLWNRKVERDVLPACRELGVGFVPWSPLGAGFLTGTVPHLMKPDDPRRAMPRFQGANLQTNLDRFEPLRRFAEERQITPAQLGLAWLLHQGDDIVPIPGSRNPEHIRANAAATGVKLSDTDLREIETLIPEPIGATAV
jgi:aryl-alcohol dehydrogenase-like predicted oxidoreductase